MRTKSILIAFSLAALLGCQTSSKSKIENIEAIKIGMDKAEVLELTGFGPKYSERKNGQDRWRFEVYVDRNTSEKFEKEVRFENGRVVYTGPVQNPAVSAAEQDRLNATAKNDNVNIDSEIKREARKQSVDLKEELAKDMPSKAKFEEVPDNAPANQ